MRAWLIVGVVAAMPFVAAAQESGTFTRPDCSAYKDTFKPEEICILKTRRQWQKANFAALQATGLTFNLMGRPDPDKAPDAKKVLEDEVEGSFVIRFSVGADGKVSEVKIVEVAGGVQPLARLWADAIAQWTFLKTDKPVADIEYRRIYMYAAEDDTGPERSSGAGLE